MDLKIPLERDFSVPARAVRLNGWRQTMAKSKSTCLLSIMGKLVERMQRGKKTIIKGVQLRNMPVIPGVGQGIAGDLDVFRCGVYYAFHKRHAPRLLKWWNWKD